MAEGEWTDRESAAATIGDSVIIGDSVMTSTALHCKSQWVCARMAVQILADRRWRVCYFFLHGQRQPPAAALWSTKPICFVLDLLIAEEEEAQLELRARGQVT